jgi:WD40 repeat protein
VLWHWTTGELLVKLPSVSNCHGLVFSPDGKLLAWTEEDDEGHSVVKVWDVAKLVK